MPKPGRPRNDERRKVDWFALKMEYATNPTVTIEDIITKYNIPEGTVRWHSYHDRWNAERESFQDKVNEKLQASAAAKSASTILRERNDQTIKWCQDMRYVINSLLQRRTEDGRNVLRDGASMRDARLAIAGYAELQRMERLALGVATDFVQAATARDRIDDLTPEQVEVELARLRVQVGPETLPN